MIQEVTMLMSANCSQMVDEGAEAVDEGAEAGAGLFHGTCHKIMSDNLNMTRVTQHGVPHVVMQD
jgi:hypothetical protein